MSHPAAEAWDSAKYYVRGLYRRVGDHHAFLMSGGLAFSLFVCSVPLLLVVFAALGSFLDSPSVVAEINSFIDRIMPYPEYAASMKSFIGERLQRTADLKQVAGLVGAVGLLFASSGLFSSLRTILNTVFRAENTESVLIGKLWDFALIFLVLVLFVLLIMALPLYETATELADNVTWLRDAGMTFAQNLMIWLASFVILVIAFASIYWLVPWYRPSRRTTLISGISAAVLWLLAKEVFGYYVSHMATLRHVYGVYAFLIVAAFWIYYSALVLIVSAEIGQLHCERHLKRRAAEQGTCRANPRQIV
jgi:membrane protein